MATKRKSRAKTPETNRDGFPKMDYEKKLRELQDISNAYYLAAIRTGVHAFIEHTGLMNEHLKILRQAAKKGLEIEHINVHGSERFPMAGNEAAYLGEKFACIFAPYFTPETFQVFAETVRKEVSEAERR